VNGKQLQLFLHSAGELIAVILWSFRY
jgi:hypothetical protein